MSGKDLRCSKQYMSEEKINEWKLHNIFYNTIFFEVNKNGPHIEYSDDAVQEYQKLDCYKEWKVRSYKGKRLVAPDGEHINADLMTGWWNPIKHFLKLDSNGEMIKAVDEYKKNYPEQVRINLRKIYCEQLFKMCSEKKNEEEITEWLSKKFGRNIESCEACLSFLEVVYCKGNIIPIIENYHPGGGIDSWDLKLLDIVDESKETAQAKKWRKYVKDYFQNIERFISENKLDDYYDMQKSKVLFLWDRRSEFDQATDDEWKDFFYNAYKKINSRTERLNKEDAKS